MSKELQRRPEPNRAQINHPSHDYGPVYFHSAPPQLNPKPNVNSSLVAHRLSVSFTINSDSEVCIGPKLLAHPSATPRASSALCCSIHTHSPHLPHSLGGCSSRIEGVVPTSCLRALVRPAQKDPTFWARRCGRGFGFWRAVAFFFLAPRRRRGRSAQNPRCYFAHG